MQDLKAALFAITASLILLATNVNVSGQQKTYHVAATGNDAGEGKDSDPLRTISAAALKAHPGDTIVVHKGIYREWINPPRGGEPGRQIVYMAAPGEKVMIKGSEIVNNWVKFSGTVWKATVSNSLFGAYNPYTDEIRGDWFHGMGRTHHTGEVYLNGKSLWEKEILEKVLHPVPATGNWDPEGSVYTWFCESDIENTYIYANFHDFDPNKEMVEINVRPACFYPDTTGINYITIQGFHLSQAATQWAPPTAEQIGLIGTNWSKGWIIENNVIRNSKCSGITLGKHGDEYDNTSENSAEGYVTTIKRAIDHGWSKENIGSHVIRNNSISDCGQTAICGSMGGAYSIIENNNIHNIWTKRQWSGAEMGGIKIHGSVDMTIRGNRVVNCGRGIWLDWMAQGARVTGNICYHNDKQDFYSEVNHGPYLVDNNIFLSICSIWEMSQGGAYVHNLIAGKLNMSPHERKTPFLELHSTSIAGYQELLSGDYNFFNNIFVRGCQLNKDQQDPGHETRLQYGSEDFGLSAFNDPGFPNHALGNVYIKGASTINIESRPLELSGNPGIQIDETSEGVFISLLLDKEIIKMKNQMVTSELLGKALISGQTYENPDRSPILLDKDMLGKQRNRKNPVPGPFEINKGGLKKILVWKDK